MPLSKIDILRYKAATRKYNSTTLQPIILIGTLNSTMILFIEFNFNGNSGLLIKNLDHIKNEQHNTIFVEIMDTMNLGEGLTELFTYEQL